MSGTRYRRVLVLGGARSGKSAFAERLALDWDVPVLYVATAESRDAEMAQRIAEHQSRRPRGWRTLEAPRGVAKAVAASAYAGGTVLLEDLTLWLSNEGLPRETEVNEDDPLFDSDVDARVIAEVESLARLPCNLVLVSNEVGMGLVPPYPSGRAFRDALGRVNQAAARIATEAYLLVAGLPIRLKPPSSFSHPGAA